MIEQQRQSMELKLHRWHKERGDAEGEPMLHAHSGSGGLVSCRWWPCTRAWLVAENVGALANFKAVQGLDGWPAGKQWSDASARDAELSPVPVALEMEREQRTDEGDPLVEDHEPVSPVHR